MRTSAKLTADALSASIGRPVRMFTSVCDRSRSFDRGLLEDSANIIRRHDASALAVIHPGFYTMDNDRAKLIDGLSGTDGESLFSERYSRYTEGLKRFLSASRIPLFLFVEEDRGLAPYSWIFDHAKPDLTLVLETTKGTFLPKIREDASDESLFWVWTVSTIRFQLGVQKISFAGEYYFVNGGIPSGCVNSAHLAMERHVIGNINTDLTFPNSPRRIQT